MSLPAVATAALCSMHRAVLGLAVVLAVLPMGQRLPSVAFANSVSTTTNNYTIWTVLGRTANIGAVAVVESSSDAQLDTIYVSAIAATSFVASVRNVSLDNYTNATLNFLVRNASAPNYATCIPNETAPPEFGANFTMMPEGLAAGFKRVGPSIVPQLLIADRIPSSRIFSIRHPEADEPVRVYDAQPLVGGACSYNSSVVLANNSIASGTPIRSPSYLTQDPYTGDVYFSQSYSVVRVDAATAVAAYYFGSDVAPGNPGQAFNYHTTRWNATTLYPAQIAIDAVGRTMYVAEGGMHTIRAINMDDGSVSVALGTFEYLLFPPPDCQLNSNCTQDNVRLISPQGVAVFRRTSPATGQPLWWLFVADATAAVIYRLDLHTGRVDTVAGKLLDAGDTAGYLGKSRLYYPSYLAAGRRHLYVADGGLYVMELDAMAPPPAPSGVDPTPQPAAEALITAAIAASVASSGAATADAIVVVMITGVACAPKSASTKASIIQDVFLFSGSLNILAVQPWALFSVWVAFSGLHLLLAVFVDRNRGGVLTVLRNGQKTVKFPNYSIVCGELVIPLTMFVAWRVFFSVSGDDADAIASCLFCIVVAGAAMVLPIRYWITQRVAPESMFTAFHWNVSQCSDPSPRSVGNASLRSTGSGGDPMSGSTIQASFTSLLQEEERLNGAQVVACEVDYLLPKGGWGPASVRKPFGTLFAKFNPEHRTKKLFELVLPSVTALLSGSASATQSVEACIASMTLVAILYMTAMVAIIALRPYRRPADNVLTPLAYALFAIICLLKAFDPTNTAAVDVTQLLQSLCLVFKVILGAYAYWFRERTYMRALDEGETKSLRPSPHNIDVGDEDGAIELVKGSAKAFGQDVSHLDREYFTGLQAQADDLGHPSATSQPTPSAMDGSDDDPLGTTAHAAKSPLPPSNILRESDEDSDIDL